MGVCVCFTCVCFECLLHTRSERTPHHTERPLIKNYGHKFYSLLRRYLFAHLLAYTSFLCFVYIFFFSCWCLCVKEDE